ncbi:MAG: tail fiber protein [Comamonas sp.]
MVAAKLPTKAPINSATNSHSEARAATLRAVSAACLAFSLACSTFCWACWNDCCTRCSACAAGMPVRSETR